MNDVRTQVEALRDLGALRPDADIDQVIVDLGLDAPPQDVVADERRGAHRATARAHEAAPRLRGEDARRS